MKLGTPPHVHFQEQPTIIKPAGAQRKRGEEMPHPAMTATDCPREPSRHHTNQQQKTARVAIHRAESQTRLIVKFGILPVNQSNYSPLAAALCGQWVGGWWVGAECVVHVHYWKY